MQLTKELIQQVAKNARLNLTDKEIKEFLPQLKEILDAFSKLDKVKIKDVKPSFQPIELKNITREDTPKISLTQDDALLNTKHKENGYFKGPKTL